MAQAYLGKISALVTANTSDFNSKLNASAKEVRSFAASMQSSITRAESSATTSLRSIYTEAQKTERALKAASSLRLSFKGIDTAKFKEIGQAADQMRRVVSASEQIYKPLAAAAKATESLSNVVRGAFQPALIAAQRQAELMNTALTRGLAVSEKSFARVQRRAEETAQAVRRLAEASSIAGSGPRGTELAFTAPRVRDSLAASAAVRQRAADAPASVLADGSVGRDVQKLVTIDNLLQKRRAEIEAGVQLNIDTSATERRLERLLAISDRVKSRISGAINAEGNGKRDADNEIALLIRREQTAKEVEARSAASAQRAADNEIALLQRREQAAKEVESRRAAAAQRTADNETALLIRREQAAKEAERARQDVNRSSPAQDNEIALLQRREQAAKEVEARSAASAQRAADNEIALLQRREQAAKEVEQRRAADAQRAADNETTLLIRREQAAKELERANQEIGRTSPFSAPDAIARQARRSVGGDVPDIGTEFGRGLDIGRQADNIGQRIAETRRQIDSLPEGVRSGLVPALQRAIDAFVELKARGAGATADELARANREAERLSRNTSRAQRGSSFGDQFGGAGRAGIEFGLQEVSLRGYASQLQVLQQTLAGVSTTARAPATAAFDRLRTAISTAAAAGRADLPAVRTEIQRLTREAVQAAAAVAGISPGRLGRQLQRAGDVGRGAFGNIGLGVQQAVFAIDDFFSVTGGLDQRIRAAGNNLSQLGFILGGTGGLIAGVAGAITAQLIVAYIKWQNAGVGTEDRLKSLNDSLTRQKSLIESLAGAFSSLADEIGRIGFSKQGQDAAAFAKKLDEIRQNQSEFNLGRAAAVDPGVQRERGIISARERELQQASDPGERVRISREIEAARRREAVAVRRIREAPQISAADAAGVAIESRRQVEAQAARESESRNSELAANARAQRAGEETQARIRGAGSASEQNRIAQDELFFERARLEQEIRANNFTGASLLAGGDNTIRRQQLAAVEAAIISLESGAVNAANELEIQVAEASAAAAKKIGLAQEKVAAAIELGVGGATGLQSELDAITSRLSEAQDALRAAQKKARESGLGADLVAAEKAREEVASIQANINARSQEVAVIDAVRSSLSRFKDALDRVAQEAEQEYQSSRQAADDARREDLGRGTTQTADARRRAEADMEDQRRARNRVDETVARARARAEEDPATVETERRISEINGMLNSTGVLAPGRREELMAERSRLEREAEDKVNRQVENDPAVRAARDDSTRIERQRQAAIRGDELRMTPAQRAAETLSGQLDDIRQSFGRQAEQGSGLVDFAAQRESQQRAVNDAVRSSAPAIFGMADQVQNALMQGPSRAALNATDVSTVEGSRELNRLLRGDDAAKNQDLVELQKQSQSLETLVQLAREQGVPATLDF